MSGHSARFYRDLPTYPSFACFFDDSSYAPLPADWSVLVADVRGSTRAIESGRYRDVNTVGVACIAAMLNGLQDLSIPFVFGGDGATFCVPACALENARAILLDCQRLARADFDLDLRIGAVPVTLLRELGEDVQVGKWQVNPHYVQAMMTGDGLGTAERLVKSSHQFLVRSSKSALMADFAGFECRWQEIPSPSEENISLLVMSIEDSALERRLTYAHVQHLIETIYGSPDVHHPVHAEGLELSLSPKRMLNEARVRNPGFNRIGKALHLASVWPLVATGRYLMDNAVQTAAADWGQYKARLRENTDYRKFDDVLRMVIAGTVAQRARLRARLEELRVSGRIAYGMHASPAALVTCIISDYQWGHVHFLDGSDGGYALAARELKSQLKAFEARQDSVPESARDALLDRLQDAGAGQGQGAALPLAVGVTARAITATMSTAWPVEV